MHFLLINFYEQSDRKAKILETFKQKYQTLQNELLTRLLRIH